jgi:hypothetical protein
LSPAHRHALLLSPGELARTPVEQLVEAEQLRDLMHPPLALLARRLVDAQAVPEVLAHGHVRIKRVVLEDHGEVALRRLESGDVAVADEDAPGSHLLQAADRAQQRRLAAAGRPDEHHELALVDRQVDCVDGDDAVGELLGDVVEDDLSHRRDCTSNPPHLQSLPYKLTRE